MGIPQEAFILDYSPVKHLLLYELSEDTADYNTHFHYVLYDCNSKGIVKILDSFNGEAFGIDEYNDITNTSFSPDGNKLAIALRSGRGLVMDLNNDSVIPFDCGETDNCAHYSNWLYFGYNCQLLHGSDFSSGTKIYDASSLTLIDSIQKNHNCAELDFTGGICLMGSEVFYKTHQSPRQTIERDAYELLAFPGYEVDTIINQRYHVVCTFEKLYFSDLKGEYNNWEIKEKDANMFRGIYAFFPGNKYLLTIIDGVRGAQYGIDIIDLVSGVVVCHFEPEFYANRIFYNANTERFAFGDEKGPNDDDVFDFPSFDHLVNLCRKATLGMVLSDSARKKFYLNKVKGD